MTNPPDSEYMKIAEAARFLGVTQRWVYRRVLSGELTASKVGGLYFINRKDLQALLDAGRVVPEVGEGPEEGTGLPRWKCGSCYRLLGEESQIGGTCETDGCGEIICQTCWDKAIHTCARHSPTREQQLKKAMDKKQAGELPVLVKASDARLSEISFLNRIHGRLCSFSTLIHPVSGEAINVTSWDEILETGDERAQLMHLLGKVVLDSATTSQMPLNAWHHYLTKSKIKKTNPLELHIQVISNLETMVREGFDTQPLGADSLNYWIEKLIEIPAKTGDFRLVLLASTTGWADSARAVINGSSGVAFSHRLALMYLYDMEQNELIYNLNDDRARRYAELFRPVLVSEELSEIMAAVIKLMGNRERITLKEAQDTLQFPAIRVEQAFTELVDKGNYVIFEIDNFGKTLVSKQAI